MLLRVLRRVGHTPEPTWFTGANSAHVASRAHGRGAGGLRWWWGASSRRLYVPGLSLLMRLTGLVEASARFVRAKLRGGDSIAIAVGGIEEVRFLSNGGGDWPAARAWPASPLTSAVRRGASALFVHREDARPQRESGGLGMRIVCGGGLGRLIPGLEKGPV
jgi:hypothetical protein